MSNLTSLIYAASPVWMQNILISMYGWALKNRQLGGIFKNAVKDFVSREDFTYQQWQTYQTKHLRKILINGARNTPYYKNVLKREGITLEDLNNFRLVDLEKLPFTEKELIRKNPTQFLNVKLKKRKIRSYFTSGTSGKPIEVKMTDHERQYGIAAYEARCRCWAGVSSKMSRAMIGGRVVVPKGEAKPPFWRYNLAERQLYMSAFHISPTNAPYYVKALNKYKPDYLVGYASSHYFLARMVCEMGLKLYNPKAVLTSSERLTQEMRSTIKNAYGCDVYDAYSGVESCCLSSECEYHQMHISPDVGIIEIVNDKGRPVGCGQVGEIVATGLINYTQPLIRYRTGDLAIAETIDCQCGRQMPVLRELVGRIEDVVVGADGREMVRFHGIFVGLPNIREGQVIQETLSEFKIRLAVDPDFGDSEKNEIKRRFKERLGTVELTFNYVDKIERTDHGKFRAVISKVKRN